MWNRFVTPLLAMAVFLAAPAAAQLPNLTYYYHPNWQYPLVPTTATGITPVVVPGSLPGNTESIYYNVAGYNNGTVATPVEISNYVKLDGLLLETWNTGMPVNAGWSFMILDRGPRKVRGGRHTFSVEYEVVQNITESNENDNCWAHQFVFTPSILSPSTPVSRSAPPDVHGGVEFIVDGSPWYANCDGFRFSSTGWWNVIVLSDVEQGEDCDLELFAPSTGSEDGFMSPLAGSYQIADYLDALVVNRNMVGTADYDVGVTRFEGISSFDIVQVVSEPAVVGTSMDVAFASGEMLKIWDTYVGSTGWVTVSVTDPLRTGQDFWVGWYDYNIRETDLWGTSHQARMDEGGEIRLHVNVSTQAYYGLVVFRQPGDGEPLPVVLHCSIEPTPPDLRPNDPASWHSPLVPLPFSHPGPFPTLPDTLIGYTPQTAICYGFGNDSPVMSPQVDTAVYRDDMDAEAIIYHHDVMGSQEYRQTADTTPREYPGGRHTLIMEMDPGNFIHEIFEANNVYGEQYCWSPMYLSAGGQFMHAMPGPVTGGWWALDPTGSFYENCDGYRIETAGAGWAGLVLTKAGTSDYDLDLHYPLVGVKEGFDDYLATSVFFEEDTDYVITNGNTEPAGMYDVGVTNLWGEDSYVVEGAGSTDLPLGGWDHHGPFTLSITRMIHLYNIYLEPDQYAFRLDNVSGTVDWGFGLHTFEMPCQGRQDAMAGAWLNGPGAPEWFTVEAPAPGWYCLAVYKARPHGFDQDGTYELTILRGVSDVPDEQDLPVATALIGVHPNPFNPQTTIFYKLAEAGDVDLSIYDLKGALVRRLAEGGLPAGRHTAVWDGRDGSGSRVSSGVYLVRFTAGAHRDIQKLVLVK